MRASSSTSIWELRCHAGEQQQHASRVLRTPPRPRAGEAAFCAGEAACFVDSCRSCDSCSKGYESYCPQLVPTSNGVGLDDGGATTQGGFSDILVVREHYVVRVPSSLRPPGPRSPLLCAGVTVFSPLVQYGLNAPGKHLGVVGLGGLGHLAVRFGKAFGMTVTVISTSLSKREEALGRLGADAFLVSRDPAHMEAAASTMDGIVDTVSADHPVTPLLDLLKPMGQMVVVGFPSKPLEVPTFGLITGEKRVAGSAGGGVGECQAMLDFAGEHGISTGGRGTPSASPAPRSAESGGEAAAPPRAPGQETSRRPRASIEGHFGTSERNMTGQRSQLTDGCTKWMVVPFTDENFNLMPNKKVQKF
ncbi:probable cinnamyl alcohol dehydrogenase 8A [Miscanthus floridulus]|uniref:probable cinnamyl alcohol dehydrogenase 8A n=1 Tax=Miscanthus floridulus TaxID=154761 RepID=UPI0034580E17